MKQEVSSVCTSVVSHSHSAPLPRSNSPQKSEDTGTSSATTMGGHPETPPATPATQQKHRVADFFPEWTDLEGMMHEFENAVDVDHFIIPDPCIVDAATAITAKTSPATTKPPAPVQAAASQASCHTPAAKVGAVAASGAASLPPKPPPTPTSAAHPPNAGAGGAVGDKNIRNVQFTHALSEFLQGKAPHGQQQPQSQPQGRGVKKANVPGSASGAILKKQNSKHKAEKAVQLVRSMSMPSQRPSGGASATMGGEGAPAGFPHPRPFWGRAFDQRSFSVNSAMQKLIAERGPGFNYRALPSDLQGPMQRGQPHPHAHAHAPHPPHALSPQQCPHPAHHAPAGSYGDSPRHVAYDERAYYDARYRQRAHYAAMHASYGGPPLSPHPHAPHAHTHRHGHPRQHAHAHAMDYSRVGHGGAYGSEAHAYYGVGNGNGYGAYYPPQRTPYAQPTPPHGTYERPPAGAPHRAQGRGLDKQASPKGPTPGKPIYGAQAGSMGGGGGRGGREEGMFGPPTKASQQHPGQLPSDAELASWFLESEYSVAEAAGSAEPPVPIARCLTTKW